VVDLAARSSMLWRLPAEDLEVVASISALVQADWSLGWRTGFLSSGRYLEILDSFVIIFYSRVLFVK